jgi:hypothetical protein
MTAMKTLDDGTVIPQATFGTIFGGGLKKALDIKRRLKIDGENFFFTIRDMSLLQTVVDGFVDENRLVRLANEEMTSEIDQLRARVRYLERKDGVVKRPRGRPRKNPIVTEDPTNVVPMKPRVRVPAGSYRSAA